MQTELNQLGIQKHISKYPVLENIYNLLGGRIFVCTENNFEKDLKFGEEKEKEIMQFIEKEFKIKCNKPEIKDYDIYGISKNGIEYTFEVKYDRLFSKTRNIAIEYIYNNKPSGISISKAKYYIYYNEEYIMINKTKELREKIKNNKEFYKIVSGGDNNLSKIFLINEENFNIFFDFIKKI